MTWCARGLDLQLYRTLQGGSKSKVVVVVVVVYLAGCAEVSSIYSLTVLVVGIFIQ
jgi:hypothetical protein